MLCMHIYVPSRKKICYTLIIVLPYTLASLRQETMGPLIINSDITNSILTLSNSSWVNEMKEIRKPSCCKWGKLVKQCKERGKLANSQVSLDNVLSHWHNRTIYLNPAAPICYITDFSLSLREKRFHFHTAGGSLAGHNPCSVMVGWVCVMNLPRQKCLFALQETVAL